MAQTQKLEVVHDVKCCPDKLYYMITRDAPQLSQYIPELVESVEVTATEEGNVFFRYRPSVEICTCGWYIYRVKGEGNAVDNKNRSITSTVIEGDVMTGFKSFKFNLDITPKYGTTDGTSLVKWSVEYEKANEDVADPVGILKSCELMTTEMNFHLLKQA
ncbi:hypothetical protein MKW98_009183 [Papaver atlanticum]|uniref:Bet v I/Major latex protein domain-containing protein n=1 Tax=Papaver atlanticum TaxID=357466 RepID=A0AAD4RZ98_9MAGN|nr:hypothetical protein MKW98_009183 [Papaver atlanticum]